MGLVMKLYRYKTQLHNRLRCKNNIKWLWFSAHLWIECWIEFIQPGSGFSVPTQPLRSGRLVNFIPIYCCHISEWKDVSFIHHPRNSVQNHLSYKFYLFCPAAFLSIQTCVRASWRLLSSNPIFCRIRTIWSWLNERETFPSVLLSEITIGSHASFLKTFDKRAINKLCPLVLQFWLGDMWYVCTDKRRLTVLYTKILEIWKIEGVSFPNVTDIN